MSLAKKLLLLAGDTILLYASLATMLIIRYPTYHFPVVWRDHAMPFSLAFVFWLFVFYLADMYRQKSFRSERVLWQTLLGTVAIATVGSIILFYLFGNFFKLTPKTNLILFAIIFSFFDYVWRYLVLAIFQKGSVPVIIIGKSIRIAETIAYLSNNPHVGYRTEAWIQNLSPNTLEALPSHIRTASASMIIIQPRIAKDPSVIRALYRLLPLETSLITFPDFYELIFEKVPLDELEEGWFVEHISTRRPFYDTLKRILDFALALCLSALFLIPAIIITLLIRLTSRGPAIFSQKRAGKHGRPFTLYKFRSMTTWTGGNDGTPAWTTENDPRLTRVGKFLRFTHLDELPQLWNILQGDASFTGPRPERIELAEKYSSIPYYEIRHIVKPGVTGWAQINYKPSSSLEEARAKLEYDIFYVKNRSFLIDITIVIRTIRYIFMSHE